MTKLQGSGRRFQAMRIIDRLYAHALALHAKLQTVKAESIAFDMFIERQKVADIKTEEEAVEWLKEFEADPDERNL